MALPDLLVEPADVETMASWDSLVRTASGSLFQTTAWANFCESYVGGEPSYWVARCPDGTIAGLRMVLRKSPGWDVFFERMFGRAILPVMRFLIPIHEAHSAPVVVSRKWESQVEHAFASHLRRWASHTGVFRKIVVTRPPQTSAEIDSSAFEASGYNVSRSQTLLIDLKKSEEELWAQLHRSARKTVSRAQREGLRVRRVHDAEELRELYVPY